MSTVVVVWFVVIVTGAAVVVGGVLALALWLGLSFESFTGDPE